MERTEAIFGCAKHYAKLMQGKPEQRLEFRKAISALWRTGVYTYAEYQYILGYVYKSLGLIEQLRALTVDDVDLDNNTINVDKTLNYFTNRPTVDSVTGFKTTRPKTSNSIRTVPMNATCRQAIEDQLAFHKSLRPTQYDTDSLGELLFTTHLNTPIYPKTYTKGINVAIKKVNEERKVSP